MVGTLAFIIDCIGPNSETGTFWLILIIGSFWVFVSSLLLRIAISVCNRRKTLHTRRTDVVTLHAIAVGTFYFLAIVGVLSGNSTEATCKSPSTSSVGVLAPLSMMALVIAIISAVIFIFWFKRKESGQSLSDIQQKEKLPYKLVSFWLLAIMVVSFSTLLASIVT